MPPSRRYSNDNTSLSEHPRPFGHVRHSPIAFSYEPVPGKRDGTHESDSILASKKHESGGRSSPPAPAAAAARMDEPPRQPKVLDTESASRKLDDLLRKQQRQATEVELQYLEMAASAAASGVDISTHQPFRGGDIHQHWLVREAEDLRLTDQLRQHERTSSSFDAGSTKPLPQETRRHSSAVAPNPQQQQQGVSSQMSNSLSTIRRPPSPKYPLGLALPASRYSSSSSSGRSEILPPKLQQKSQEQAQDDQQVVAVSAAQRCSHCENELGK